MNAITAKAIQALESLPEPFQQEMAAYVVEQAEKHRALRAAVEEGMADVRAGRVVPWEPDRYRKIIDDIASSNSNGN